MSCMATSTRSNAPLYPARVFSNFSVGAPSGNNEPGASCVAAFLPPRRTFDVIMSRPMTAYRDRAGRQG
jgi:hypothetical protein